MLGAALQRTECAAHTPDEVDWEHLPDRCIVAMHWRRSPAFHRFLLERQFEVLVTVRHPLDVLISILHFAQYEPMTRRWLEGEGGNETSLLEADPTSDAFLAYALSGRASALFEISAEWYGIARAIVQYERLVMQPEDTLDRAIRSLGYTAPASIVEIIRAHTIERLRPLSHHHFWRGEPGLWRQLITGDFSRKIYDRHERLFEALGYNCAGDSSVSLEEAKDNWKRLCETDPPREHPAENL
jgi:hypothetical protein